MFDKILLCSDGSDHAQTAAEAAVEIAKKFGSRVILVNVFTYHPDAFFLGTEAAPVYWESAAETQEHVQRDVEQHIGQVLERAGVKYEYIREKGHAVDRIVDVARQQNADLIVLGSRGLGGFTRVFLGSVSDGVLHHAHCPVLIVR